MSMLNYYTNNFELIRSKLGSKIGRFVFIQIILSLQVLLYFLIINHK